MFTDSIDTNKLNVNECGFLSNESLNLRNIGSTFAKAMLEIVSVSLGVAFKSNIACNHMKLCNKAYRILLQTLPITEGLNSLTRPKVELDRNHRK